MKIIYSLVLLGMVLKLSAQEVSVYLIGDAGKPNLPTDLNLEYLKENFADATTDDILVFLGDNVYPVGIPDKEDPSRKDYENLLKPSLDLMRAFPGRSFIIPGNHDWAKGKKNGWRQIQNMQEFVDEYVGDQVSFQPRNGCPGPVGVELNDQVTLIILDTQYFLHPWDKPGEEEGCESKSTTAAILQLEDLVIQNKDKNVLIAGHHPMYSYGPHGGRYTFRQHLFPLTDINRKLYIPLPVIGSIYPGYRSLIGSPQDIPHPRYRLVRNAIVETFDQGENVVYVNGHEHSLQYIARGGHHYVTSGSGSKSSNVSEGKHTRFAHKGKGFAKLTYRVNGDVQLRFFDGSSQSEIYSEKLYTKMVEKPIQKSIDFDFADSTVVAPISVQYAGANKNKEFWLGKNYRELWATPVEMEVFNIDREYGGLKILKMGGGNQTRSLRLEANDGRQYVLRSLEKYTEKLIPDALKKSLAADVIQDQISGANPYGAFAIPFLAESAGIYHTNPKLVYVPDDPRFGEYQRIFKGLPVLYEERPNDEAAVESHFGEGVDVKGTDDMLLKLRKDNDEQVDQDFALRSRLFDMIIADWDRHDDQWRWVAVEKGKGHRWRPIPRDRDQAFFVTEGFVGWLASRKWALPNTEGFHPQINYPPGFNTSARFFDRSFLNELEWKDWEEEIAYLENHLTDEVIAEAFEVWPKEIHDQAAEKTIDILKSRRNDMARFARIHYLFLSKEVEVVGSNKKEYFLVERLENGRTKLTVRKINKEGEVKKKLYERTFLPEETREIRLYGLGGNDIFEINGSASEAIKVRIIGGEGEDKITDQSRIKGPSKTNFIYDLKGTNLVGSKETRNKLSEKSGVNEYNRKEFKYNKTLPLVSVQFNPDDGVFIGGGFLYTKHKWRKAPFDQKHSVTGNLALATNGFNFYYNGTFTDVLGKWDLNADLGFQQPFGVSNYFGLGNRSTYDFNGESVASAFDDEIDFYRVRYQRSENYVSLSRNLGERGMFKIGPEFLRYDLSRQNDRFISSGFSDLDQESIYDPFNYLGVRAEIQTDTRNHPGMPTQGLFANLTYEGLSETQSNSDDIQRISGEFSFLLSTKIPSRITLANRIGGEHNFNTIEFFNGANIGKSTVRGYRRTRFVGNSSLYHNVDLRINLFTIRTYLLPIGTGLIGFHDLGRVWLDGEESIEWHTSRGFGLWISPLNQIAITASMAFTEEENIPIVTFGYQF